MFWYYTLFISHVHNNHPHNNAPFTVRHLSHRALFEMLNVNHHTVSWKTVSTSMIQLILEHSDIIEKNKPVISQCTVCFYNW